MAVLFLAISGLTATAGPSHAAQWYGGRYNRVVNCYGAIVASGDLMTRGANCHWNGSHFTIYTKEKGDVYKWTTRRFNQIGNCYKAIKESASLMSDEAACHLYYKSYYSIDLMYGPYNG
ncbi:hypothetical protein ACIA49_38690 [Kribbella sp. NPDC051587]|uniref:hypothetical protein n=1 Tax=Kribbella sp. NPDC051587 TaxID=3364119 RepID=UPI00379BB5D2